jgi:predicted nucleic-acid-binding protein
VIDIFGKTEDFFYSYSAYDVALTQGFATCIPMFATADIAYILKRSYLGTQDTRRALANLLELFEIIDGHPQDCLQAINSTMPDYEDALIAFAAKRNDVDFIITRNKRDFVHSPVPALTPEEFVHLYNPENVTYEMTTL